jgi:hypothetical protein
VQAIPTVGAGGEPQIVTPAEANAFAGAVVLAFGAQTRTATEKLWLL